MFKVYKKVLTTGVLIVNFELNMFHTFSSVSVAAFEEVNIIWDYALNYSSPLETCQ